jgi:FixJ family two-component response regulator
LPAKSAARRIVVVEDDASMSCAIERILRLAGFAPQTFDSAEKMLEAEAAAGTACFVFDVHLPGLTGFELRERMARSGAQAPVIFITAFDEPRSRRLAERAGAVGYFTKPFSGHELVAAVARAVAEPAPPGSKGA